MRFCPQCFAELGICVPMYRGQCEIQTTHIISHFQTLVSFPWSGLGVKSMH